MVASNLAFAFAQENRISTLLLDFDQKACGDQSIITGVKSKKNIKDLAEFNGSIDPKSVLQFVGTHPQKVNVINMPKDATAAEQIVADGLGKALKGHS